MKRSFQIRYLLPLCILFYSCEYSYKYSYIITNNSSDTISVRLTENNSTTTESTLNIGETKTIHTTTHGVEGPKGPHFQDVEKDFLHFTIKKQGVDSQRDFLSNGNWEFSDGKYSTSISDSEF